VFSQSFQQAKSVLFPAISMKAFAVTEYRPVGDISALVEHELPKPAVSSGRDLVVKVKAVATNPVDVKALANLGDPEAEFKRDKPLLVGWDAAGVVEAVGEEASLFKEGDEVFFAGNFFGDGCFAEYVLVDERVVGMKPKSLTWSQAAGEPLTMLTACEGLVEQLQIPEDCKSNAGKTILITGGAGGAATAAIEVAKKYLGLTVIATGSRDDSIQYVKDLGADHVINHHKPLSPQLKELGIDAVDYVFDCYGLTTEKFTEFSGLVKPLGAICSTSPIATVNLVDIFFKSVRFAPVFMFTRPNLHNDESLRQHEILTLVSKLVDDGTFVSRETVNKKLTLENLKEALVLQASGKAIGKITLTFDDSSR